MMSSTTGSDGPCGACKFLRRKCVKGCIFAPYFDSEQLGTAHFAAVHKVFGASNASKLLQGIPVHRRLDAVVTLCYEALARVRDPVYGCVAHIFALQQQVVNLQAELAYMQARMSTLRLPPLMPPILTPTVQEQPTVQPAAAAGGVFANIIPSLTSTIADCDHVSLATQHYTCTETTMIELMPCFRDDLLTMKPEPLRLEEDNDSCDLQTLTHEFISKYLPDMKFMP
ncbi:hypothetical protein Dimus_025121 [Dionaea muscipula]